MNSSQGAKGRALIVGGSMAGLFSALLLARIGWDVQIFERVDGELDGRGAGIGTHAELIDALSRAGIDRTDEVGTGLQADKQRPGGEADGEIAEQVGLEQFHGRCVFVRIWCGRGLAGRACDKVNMGFAPRLRKGSPGQRFYQGVNRGRGG